MTPNLNYFNKDALKHFDENYKISKLSSMSESDVDLLRKSGFFYNFETNNFTSNILITNTLYNIIITYNDSNFRMYVKLSTANNYSDATNKFSVNAKKTLITSSTNTTAAKYEYSIEYMLFKFEAWVERTEYTNIKTALVNKIGNRVFEINYKKDDVIYHKINNNKVSVKITDEKSESYDITNKILSKDDLLSIDKIVTEKIKDIEEKNNVKMSFNQFSAVEKNTIQ